MVPDSLRSFLEQVRMEVESALEPSGAPAPRRSWGRATLEVAFTATRREDGGYTLEPCGPSPERGAGSGLVHRLILEFPGSSAAGLHGPGEGNARSPAGRSVGGLSTLSAPVPASEPVTGGDPATLRRRLEFVLGGPPGFNRGAQAEILADLLREFGRAELLASLERDWIPQFDSGPDSSPSVTKIP